MIATLATLPLDYVEESRISPGLDTSLRDLLSLCFNEERHSVFRFRNYAEERPDHRWVVRERSGSVLGHLAMHERKVYFGGNPHRVGFLSNLCVHPVQRHMGLQERLIAAAHDWMDNQGIEYSLVVGELEDFRTSGYEEVNNIYRAAEGDAETACLIPVNGLLASCIVGRPWPVLDVFLPGALV